ncbi:MAG: hypothetical protein ACI8V4_002163, partial [Ilumatobacter sp.]
MTIGPGLSVQSLTWLVCPKTKRFNFLAEPDFHTSCDAFRKVS